MGDVKHLRICQTGTVAVYKQSGWSIAGINFLIQVIDETSRVDALLDPLPKQGRELLGDAALDSVPMRKCRVQDP